MPAPSNALITSLYRYPVKGLSPERLPDVALAAGRTFPGDRAYALENGPSGFDGAAPSYLPKIKFLMLMKQERLARLKTRYDDASGVLTIVQNDQSQVSGCLRTPEGCREIEAFFADRFADDLRGPPKVLFSDGFSFSDVAEKCVSIINLESVRDLEHKIGHPIDPLRFRGNIYVDGLPAWSEFDWVGHNLQAGAVSLSVFARIQRCAATNVDPTSGVRDQKIPNTLMEQYGHMDCGVYATVTSNGILAQGDVLAPTKSSAEKGLPF